MIVPVYLPEGVSHPPPPPVPPPGGQTVVVSYNLFFLGGAVIAIDNLRRPDANDLQEKLGALSIFKVTYLAYHQCWTFPP